MLAFNAFRILGDLSHLLSKCIIIFAIHRNSSAEGVSLITQNLYAVVFVSRYLDLFHSGWLWNLWFKIIYILTSFYIIFIMMKIYARTREQEKAWKFGGACLVGSAVLAPFVMMIFERKWEWGFVEFMRVFSLILESVCVLPQLLLLRQTTVPTVIDSFYLLALGSYRGFYILNWIWRGIEAETPSEKPEPIPIIFGVIQTAFYIDFAWVYYMRQRVKLRRGGLVDSDDLRSGWLLRGVFGNKHITPLEDGDDEESAPAPALGNGNGNGNGNGRPGVTRSGSNKWGSRGISVSADEGVLESERARQEAFGEQEDGFVAGEGGDADAKMKDPDELAKILEDDDDEEDLGGSSSAPKVGSGHEWDD